MIDPRIEKLADLLTRYSLKLTKGQTVQISGSVEAAPLIKACYRYALRRGAHPETNVSLDGMQNIFYAEAKKHHLEYLSPFAMNKARKLDASIRILADTNTRAMTGVAPSKLAATNKASRPLFKTTMKRTAEGDFKWVLTKFPTNAAAQDAEMSMVDYEDFVFTAGHLDAADPVAEWQAISKAQRALTTRLNRAKEIRLVAPDTDLTFTCKGRTWINCDGQLNFPDGEIFTGPVEESVSGHVRFSFPAVYQGREVLKPFLVFEKGKVVRAEAEKGQDFLREMIAMDRGASFLGEAAFGTNYQIQQYTRNTLFDEKIGGTMHFALGAAYPETGSSNQSALHWDLVVDLRSKGEVYADGTKLQEKGRFLDKRFPQPARKKPAGRARRKS